MSRDKNTLRAGQISIGHVILSILFLFCLKGLYAQPLAFPGAEGYGKYTQGGRSGIVLYVNNLNDSGTGSLRDALTSESYKGKKRTIVFSVSGNIALKSTIEIKYDSYITIAGQTAPGDGICIKDFPIKIGDCHDITIRYLRFRIGDEQDCGSATGCDDLDALSVRKSYNIILDHCSLGWSIDDVLDLTVTTGYSTVQYCLLHEPLKNSKHSKGAHGYIAGWDGSSYGDGSVLGGGSYHHNLLVSGASRTPRLDKYAGDNGERDIIDIVNNVIYNWSGNGAYGGENADVNWQNNYYKYGPSTTNKTQIFLPGDTCRMYVDGNYMDGSKFVTADNSKGIRTESTFMTVQELLFEKPYNVWFIEMQTAEDAFESVLKQAGAFLPKRDMVDKRIVNDVLNRTGKIIDSPSEVGGWPDLLSTDAPLDTDKDGMPDLWEDNMGLNKNDPTDRNTIEANAYTMLEVYLNSIEFNYAVTGIQFSNAGENDLRIGWSDTYIGEDGFIIEKSTDGLNYSYLDSLAKNVTEYIDSTQSAIPNLYYRIVAFQNSIVTPYPSTDYIENASIEIISPKDIFVGDTVQMVVELKPENSYNRAIKWDVREEDLSRATISNSGQLIALDTGMIQLSVKTLDGLELSNTLSLHINEYITGFRKNYALAESFEVFPNPFENRITIRFNENLAADALLSICSISGIVLRQDFPDSNQFEIDTKSFPKGMYIISIQNNGKISNSLIVKY